MSATTTARPSGQKSAHWYKPDGQPFYEIMGKTTGRMRPVTVRDASGVAYPSVTTILRVLAKPALEAWKAEQYILAALTLPPNNGETDNEFAARVIRDADAEGAKSAEKGAAIHDAIDSAVKGKPYDEAAFCVYVSPVAAWLNELGKVARTEFCVVGEGYAGRVDCEVVEPNGARWIVDFKTTKTLPKKDKNGNGGYPEAHMQLGAYAQAVAKEGVSVRTANVYISTTNPGEIVTFKYDGWHDAWLAFRAAMDLWKFTAGKHWMPPNKETSVEAALNKAGL